VKSGLYDEGFGERVGESEARDEESILCNAIFMAGKATQKILEIIGWSQR
jgi:hypothetical protein